MSKISPTAYRFPEPFADVQVNFCKVGDDKQTPAMRLGLAQAPIAIKDVLYFEGDSAIARKNKKVAPMTGTTFNEAQL